MEKQVIIGIMLILVTVGLSGCTDNNDVPSKTNQEKILGQWTGTALNSSQTMAFNFLTNGSSLLTVSEVSEWVKYTMTSKTLTTTQRNGATTTFDYTFSDNDNTLTLILPDSESSIIFTRL